MIKKLTDLSIGQMIFIISIAIVGAILMLATVTTNQIIFTRTDKLIESTSKEINKQVIMNYENYLSNVIDISNSLQGYIVEYTEKGNIEELNRLFVATTNIEKNIRSVALLSEYGQVVSSSISNGINPRIAYIDWFKQAMHME
jgi:CHASE3 domain sensor protein